MFNLHYIVLLGEGELTGSWAVSVGFCADGACIMVHSKFLA